MVTRVQGRGPVVKSRVRSSWRHSTSVIIPSSTVSVLVGWGNHVHFTGSSVLLDGTTTVISNLSSSWRCIDVIYIPLWRLSDVVPTLFRPKRFPVTMPLDGRMRANWLGWQITGAAPSPTIRTTGAPIMLRFPPLCNNPPWFIFICSGQCYGPIP